MFPLQNKSSSGCVIPTHLVTVCVQWQLVFLLSCNSASVCVHHVAKCYTKDSSEVLLVVVGLHINNWQLGCTNKEGSRFTECCLRLNTYPSSLAWSFAGFPEVRQTILVTVSSVNVDLTAKYFILGLQITSCFHHISNKNNQTMHVNKVRNQRRKQDQTRTNAQEVKQIQTLA